jgi:anhydro-N-acetylmuramic acid kinase
MKKYDVVGLMSGTSLDGLDIAFVRFFQDPGWRFEVIECQSVAYEKELFTKLSLANKFSATELKQFDIYYGKWIGKQVKRFVDSNQFTPELIVSHGHTIFHQPEIGLTLQIGDGYQIMLASGIKTICDLRSFDVALGGQGAPLVPIGDKLLFNAYDFFLNLGGFSNISFEQDGKRIAYDICPVNTVLNSLASILNLEFDKGGEIAKSGNPNLSLLKKLNSLDYYGKKPPKSLGIEWVREHVFSMLDGDSIENLLNTFNHHIAEQISLAIQNSTVASHKSRLPKMLITGGGAKNDFLIELIKDQTKEITEIIIPDVQTIDFKEAIIFAFLGLLRSLGSINTLNSVTGAKADSSGGLIYDNLDKQ